MKINPEAHEINEEDLEATAAWYEGYCNDYFSQWPTPLREDNSNKIHHKELPKH